MPIHVFVIFELAHDRIFNDMIYSVEMPRAVLSSEEQGVRNSTPLNCAGGTRCEVAENMECG